MTAKKRAAPQSLTQLQDTSLFILRLLLVIGIVTALFLGWVGSPPPLTALLLAFIVSLVANLMLVVFMSIPAVAPHSHWMVILGDWVIAGALIGLIRTDVTLSLLLVAGLGFPSFIRLGARLGSINLIGLVAIFVGEVLYLEGSAATLPSYTAVAVTLLVVGGGVAVMLQMQDRQIKQQTLNIRNQATERLAMVQDMQARTMAITEMAQMLSSTLNYRRVLDAALNVGKLALRSKEITSFLALVLLYRPEDQLLYVETGRGMSRRDENRTTAGQDGLIAETLSMCVPRFSENARKDPELQQFHSLKMAKSIVIVPLRAGYDNYGVLIFASQTPEAFDARYKSFLEAIGTQTTIALQNAVLYQNLADEKERLIEADEAARHKLARNLHDGPTQSITAIAMRMAIAKGMLQGDLSKAAEELDKLEDLAYKTTDEIRGMMFALRPLALENKGLDAALQQLAEKTDAIYDQKVEVMVSESAEEAMTTHQSNTIFYIIEEAINNARKHAESDVIRVRVTRYDDIVLVEITDDGKGFDVQAVSQNYEGRTSLGMINLHDRTEMVDGTLSVESKPGQGTTISVVVPVDPAGTNPSAQPSIKTLKNSSEKVNFRLTAIR